MSEVLNETPPVEDWRASLPEDLRAEKSLESFRDIGSLAKSYVETKKLVGSKTEGMVKVPGEGATPEERAAFHKAIGVPEAPTAYKITRPESALDGTWDEHAEADFLTRAHQAGLTQAQVSQVVDWYGKFIAGQLTKAQQEAQATATRLKEEWGPNYDPMVGRANRAVQEFGGDEVVDFLAKTGLGRHPLMVKTFAKIGNALVEHGALAASGPAGMTAAEAQAKIDEIRRDKKHPFNDANHRDHDRALEELQRLYELRNRTST